MSKIKKKEKIIGIILTYNCAGLVEKTYSLLPKKLFDSIIIVDDGSKDNIADIAKKLKIPFYSHRHSGYGGNVKYGLKKSLQMGADYIVEVHGDGQYDPGAVLPALNKIKEGYALLLGSRFVDLLQPLQDKMPLSRYVANIVLSFIYRVILGVNLTEFHTGFHIYSKEFISIVGFKNTSNGHIYSLEIIFQSCFKKLPICEIPIRCDYASPHTSISIKKSIIYTFESFFLSSQYILAKIGIKYGIFKNY